MILNPFVSENLKKKLTHGHVLRNVRNRIYTDITNTMNRNLKTLGGGTSSKEQVLYILKGSGWYCMLVSKHGLLKVPKN